MRDIHSGSQVASLIDSGLYSADTTPVAVDLKGFKAAEIILSIGAGGITFTGTNKVEFKLSHSADGQNYDPVGDDDVLGVSGSGGIIKSLTAAHASATVSRFGYVGNRRFLKLLADFGGTHATGTQICATAMLAKALVQPTSDQG